MKRSFSGLNPEILKIWFIFGINVVMLIFYVLLSFAALHLPKIAFDATHSMVAAMLIAIAILIVYLMISLNCIMIAIIVVLTKEWREKVYQFVARGNLRRLFGWPTMKFYEFSLND